MTTGSILVRDANAADATALLTLMRELAVFEGYIDDFRVTEDELLRRGFGPKPEFFAVVAEASDEGLVGMAVGYLTPFTYNLEPAATLKELFVRASHRSYGLGHKLLTAFAKQALAHGAGSMRWTVLAENHPAQRFYQKWGGTHDASWEPWKMDAAAMQKLANFHEQ